jgi:hypothetical protein
MPRNDDPGQFRATPPTSRRRARFMLPGSTLPACCLGIAPAAAQPRYNSIYIMQTVRFAAPALLSQHIMCLPRLLVAR